MNVIQYKYRQNVTNKTAEEPIKIVQVKYIQYWMDQNRYLTYQWCSRNLFFNMLVISNRLFKGGNMKAV